MTLPDVGTPEDNEYLEDFESISERDEKIDREAYTEYNTTSDSTFRQIVQEAKANGDERIVIWRGTYDEQTEGIRMERHFFNEGKTAGASASWILQEMGNGSPTEFLNRYSNHPSDFTDFYQLDVYKKE